jgi:hypothetical protein
MKEKEMIKTIIMCDKCKETEENTRTFISVNFNVPSKYTSKQLNLCPKCFVKLDFMQKELSNEPTTAEQLYDFIYNIAAEAVENSKS